MKITEQWLNSLTDQQIRALASQNNIDGALSRGVSVLIITLLKLGEVADVEG